MAYNSRLQSSPGKMLRWDLEASHLQIQSRVKKRKEPLLSYIQIVFPYLIEFRNSSYNELSLSISVNNQDQHSVDMPQDETYKEFTLLQLFTGGSKLWLVDL